MRKAILVCVVTLVSLSTTAAAGASEPYIFHTRGVDRAPETPLVLPAGVACPFGLGLTRVSKDTYWMFSDGHEAVDAEVEQTWTNLGTNTSVDHLSAYRRVVFHHDDGTTLEIDHGSFAYIFFAGDQGPNGLVGPGGETYFMTGTAQVTFGADGAIAAFSFSGQSTDVCALLSA
jgi:hypothetical protein